MGVRLSMTSYPLGLLYMPPMHGQVENGCVVRKIRCVIACMQAAIQGRWLVIEGIELAHADVLAALVPLMEARQLQLTQRAQTEPAASGFQIIATGTTLPCKQLLRLHLLALPEHTPLHEVQLR